MSGGGGEETEPLAPQPFLSPLDTTFASPLPPPEEEPPAEGGVLPTTSASSSPLPEPGDPVPGSETRYRPYGEVRTPGEPVAGLTAHTFTGQALDPDTGLMYYRARWYDPRLGRFVQADTVVPEAGNPQALNRYAYVLNNPLRYTDPSGHWYGPDRYDPAGIETQEEGLTFWKGGTPRRKFPIRPLMQRR